MHLLTRRLEMIQYRQHPLIEVERINRLFMVPWWSASPADALNTVSACSGCFIDSSPSPKTAQNMEIQRRATVKRGNFSSLQWCQQSDP